MSSAGLIYVFTGEGKGKTSAALGVSLRSLLLGKSVSWIAFYKQESWGLAESKLKDRFANLTMRFGGRGFDLGGKKLARVGNKGNVVIDTATKEEHIAAAKANLQLAKIYLSKKPFLLVMDEVLNAVSEGLIVEKELLEIVDLRGETHLVLTGRGMTKKIEKVADLVTECRKIKHPYDKGKLAVAGLDF